MADNILLVGASGNYTATTVQLPDGSHTQILKIADGVHDSTTRMAVKTTAAVAGDGGAVVRPVPGLLDSGGTDMTNTSTHGLKVHIVGDDIGSLVATENGSVASGQASVALTLNLPYTWNGSSWVRGGWSKGFLISGGVNNHSTSVKGAAGVLGFATASNTSASARYLKFYDKVAAPTVGTDVPVLVFLIPGNTAGGGTNIPIPVGGLAFTVGIGLGITTGPTNADTGIPGANEVILNYGFF